MTVPPLPSSFTKFGLFSLYWLLISAFQYGFHISALNQISDVLMCRDRPGAEQNIETLFLLPSCIPMTDAQFSIVTAIFTVGGLGGSLLAGLLTDGYGRRGALLIAALFTFSGSFILFIASGVSALILARFLIGLAAGVSVSVGPVFLGELAPPATRGKTGVLFQLSIVFGILATQTIGLVLSSPWFWRFVPLVSAAIALVQGAAAAAMPESHAWLAGNGQMLEAEQIRERLWIGGSGAKYESLRSEPADIESRTVVADEEADIDDPPLYSEGPSGPVFEAHTNTKAISLWSLLRSPDLRTPVYVVASAMAAQQLSGINAVLYYSNAILGKTLPSLGPYVSLAITVVNAAMTFPPIFLIERIGRKKLLNISMIGSLVSLLAVGYGLNAGHKVLASLAIITYVASFACGLGPVPFVVISDIAPYHAVAALSSAALSLNWTANFLVGLVFLPLRNFLSQGDPFLEGRVFYVFATALTIFGLVLNNVYHEIRQ